MKAYWTGTDKELRKKLKKIAAKYRTVIHDYADIVAVAGDDNKVMGFSVIETGKDFADIVFFLVFDEYRGRGCGHLMIREIEDALRKAGVGMLRYIMPQYEDLHGLFSSEGFEVFPGDEEYAVLFKELRYSEWYLRAIAGKEPGKAKSVKDMNAKEAALLRSFLEEHAIPQEGGLDTELSTVYFRKGRVSALVLCERAGHGVVIDLIHAVPGAGRDALRCVRLLDKIIYSSGDMTDDMLLSFDADDDTAYNLLSLIKDDAVEVKKIKRASVVIKVL